MIKYRYKINKKKLAEIIFSAVCVAGLLWFGASYIDIIWDNTTTANHASWNLFRILLAKGGLL